MQPIFCRPSPVSSSSILTPFQELDELFWLEKPQNVQVLFDTRRIVQLLPKPKQIPSSSINPSKSSDFEAFSEIDPSPRPNLGQSISSSQNGPQIALNKSSSFTSSSSIEDFFNKLSNAFVQRLIPSEQDSICNYLISQPEKVAQQLEEKFFEKLTPNQFSSLTVNNDKIATELLVALHTHNPKSFMLEQFTSLLFDMPASIHSFNIINNFMLKINKNPVPDVQKKYDDKLSMFLKKSIDSLNFERDSSQLRVKVRLLCCFVQSLLRKKLLDSEAWAPELQNLALSYPDIREAIDLLKLISIKKQTST